MKINHQLVSKAIRIAKRSDVKRSKIGAIIFNGSGHILVSAFNCRIYGKDKIFTIHAEQSALAKAFKIKATERYGQLYMLVVRQNHEGQLSNACPCEKCQVYIKSSGIKVFYSNADGLIKPLKLSLNFGILTLR